MGVLKPAEIIAAAVAAAKRKEELSWSKTLVAGFMAGAFIAMGGFFSLRVGGGVQSAAPGAQRLYFGAVFPVGLMLVVLTGAELVCCFACFSANLFSRIVDRECNVYDFFTPGQREIEDMVQAVAEYCQELVLVLHWQFSWIGFCRVCDFCDRRASEQRAVTSLSYCQASWKEQQTSSATLSRYSALLMHVSSSTSLSLTYTPFSCRTHLFPCSRPGNDRDEVCHSILPKLFLGDRVQRLRLLRRSAGHRC